MAYKKVVLEGDATVDIFAANSIQLSSENFADNDTSLMTSAAINDRIAAVSSNTSGTVTSVATGSGLTGGAITSSGTVSIDFSGLDDIGTFTPGDAVNGDVDGLVVSDDGAAVPKIAYFQDIPLSFFNNDAGFTSNNGDITAVNITTATGSGLTGGANKSSGSASFTLALDFDAVADGGTKPATGDQIHTFVTGQGYTSNTGTVTSIATGVGISGGTITGSGTIALDLSELAKVDASSQSFQPGDSGGGVGDVDGLVVYDDSAHNSQNAKIAHFGDIPLSFFNNDSGFTSNSGDITQVQLVSDSGTLTDSSGNVSFTIAGGTGLSSSATGSTLTINAAQDIATDADVQFANLTLSGDLTVTGKTITTSAETLEIADNTIVLNSDLGSSAAVDCGFVFERGSDGNNRTMFYDESADKFVTSLNSSAALGGTYQADMTQTEVNSTFSNSSTKVPVGHFQWNGSNLYVRTS